MKSENDHGPDFDALWQIPGAVDIEKIPLRVGDIVVESMGEKKHLHYSELRGYIDRGAFSIALRSEFSPTPEIARETNELRTLYVSSLEQMKLVQESRDMSNLSPALVQRMMRHIQRATRLELLWLQKEGGYKRKKPAPGRNAWQGRSLQ